MKMKALSVAAPLFVLSFVLGACGQHTKSTLHPPEGLESHPNNTNDLGEPEPRVDSTGIVLESTVSKRERVLLNHDLNYLSRLNLADNAELRHVMGLNEVSANALQNWLGARMHYVFSDTSLPLEKFTLGISVARKGDFYPNNKRLSLSGGEDWVNTIENILKRLQASSTASVTGDTTATPLPASSGNEITVMAVNLGSGLYMRAKENCDIDKYGNRKCFVLRFNFNGQPVEVSSPRIGLIQIAKAFGSLSLNKETLKAESNSIFRLATLFHEARHSDGNGHTVGFGHVECPEGHDYAKNFACDVNNNGPYMLEAKLMASMAKACTHCSDKETETLRILFLDNVSRVLTDWKPAARESARVASLIDTMNQLVALPDTTVEDDNILNILMEPLANYKVFLDDIAAHKVTEWDSSPESLPN